MIKHATNNVMPNMKRKMRKDKFWTAFEIIICTTVFAAFLMCMFVYAVDTLIPVP